MGLSGIFKWELCILVIAVTGVIIVAKAKSLSVKEKFIWIMSILIFNIFAIIIFFIWKKTANKK